MDKVLVVVGPTASGKSDLGVLLAKKYSGEIISGDSVQVYRHFDIGSSKIKEEKKQGVIHHLIDILDEKQEYSVYDFQNSARKIIEEISRRNKLAIIVGGTGLYIKALIYDYNFLASEKVNNDYSEYSNKKLYELLLNKDKEAAEKIHINNRKRLIRNLNLLDELPGNKTEFLAKQKKEMIYNTLIVGLTMDRALLHKRINERVDFMFENGLVEEVESLLKEDKLNFNNQAMQAIGYKEFAGYYNNEYDLKEVKEQIKTHTRQFAKRQYTWFNNQMNVIWFDIYQEDYLDKINKTIENWI